MRHNIILINTAWMIHWKPDEKHENPCKTAWDQETRETAAFKLTPSQENKKRKIMFSRCCSWLPRRRLRTETTSLTRRKESEYLWVPRETALIWFELYILKPKVFSAPRRAHRAGSICFSSSSEDGEKKDHDKSRDEAPRESSVEEKKALKKRLGQRKEPPEAFMASFLASLEVYQTKMLVSPVCLAAVI